MSNYQLNKTDPLWFLDSHEDQKENENTDTNNKDSKTASDDDIFDISSLKEADAKLLEQMDRSDYESNSVDNNESISEAALQKKVVQDRISLKSELEKSIFDLARRSIGNGKTPEFRITISTNDDTQSSGNTRVINIDPFILNNNEASIQNEQSDKVNVEANSEDNTNSLNESSIDQLNTESMNDKATQEVSKPKVFVVLKSNSFNNNGNIADIKSDTAEEICSEIGSSVINLNDYISPEAQPLSGSENISTSVNFNNDDGQNHKVELVVTIKDERKQPVDEPSTKNTYTNEINTDFPNLDTLLNESLEEKIKRLSERVQKLSSSGKPVYAEPSQPPKPTKGEKWTTETKNSYVRDDGARCYRTVTSTPQGRRVQTQCYNGDRRRARLSYGWPWTFGSIWNDLDDDIDLMLSRGNRFMFF